MNTIIVLHSASPLDSKATASMVSTKDGSLFFTCFMTVDRQTGQHGSYDAVVGSTSKERITLVDLAYGVRVVLACLSDQDVGSVSMFQNSCNSLLISRLFGLISKT